MVCSYNQGTKSSLLSQRVIMDKRKKCKKCGRRRYAGEFYAQESNKDGRIVADNYQLTQAKKTLGLVRG